MWNVAFNNLNLHVIQLLNANPCDDDRACSFQASFWGTITALCSSLGRALARGGGENQGTRRNKRVV